MDKRISMLKGIYLIHAQLIEVYHSSSQDHKLLEQFCSRFIEFANAISPNHSTRHFEHLFKASADLRKKEELSAHLIAALEYATELKQRMAAQPDINIDNEIVAVLFDYAKLLKATAKAYGLPEDTFAGSRNTKVSAYTSFKIATQFFSHPKTIQRSNTLNGFTIFALRQALESGAKEVMGIKAIYRIDGKPDRGNTQLPWSFLVAHAEKTYLNLPFEPAEMQVIYQWSNHFVHTGTDAPCYVTAKAIRTVDKLFQRIKVPGIFNEDDWVYANIITKQMQLRSDFESYLAGLPTPRYSEWTHAPLAHVSG